MTDGFPGGEARRKKIADAVALAEVEGGIVIIHASCCPGPSNCCCWPYELKVEKKQDG